MSKLLEALLQAEQQLNEERSLVNKLVEGQAEGIEPQPFDSAEDLFEALGI